MADWWWAYLALGAFVGFFNGMLGIGGGSAAVPVLAFVFAAQGFAPDHAVRLALGTGISAILFTSVVSVRAHHLRRSVNWRALRLMAPGVLAGTFAGASSRALECVCSACLHRVISTSLSEPRAVARPAARCPALRHDCLLRAYRLYGVRHRRRVLVVLSREK